MTEFVTIFEVSPRDGLQNEPNLIPTRKKVELVNLLSTCQFKKIEVTSFVSPKWVPQMADADEVIATIVRKPEVTYTALTPNVVGLERAIAVGVDEVAIFASASESFSLKNINCSIAESMERFKSVVDLAKKSNIPVRGYISCAICCPYDGETPPEKVAGVADSLLKMGVYEISLGDTIGVGTPETTKTMLEAVLTVTHVEKVAGHFHNTNNRALDNIDLSLQMGLRTFDSSVGGMGGCPFAGSTKGNVDTFDVVSLMKTKGFETGIDISALEEASKFATELRRS